MKMCALAFAVFLLFASFAGAQQTIINLNGLGAGICDSLFSSGNGVTGTAQPASYAALLEISLFIVLMVMTALGVIYGLGYAFEVESLKRFSRTEALESVFNIIIIAFIATGLTFASGAVSFISNIAQLGISNIPGQSFSSGSPTFPALCANYLTKGLDTSMNGALELLPSLYTATALQNLKLSFQYSLLSFSISPFAGWNPWSQILNLELDLYFTLGGILSAVAVFLYVIAFLFPFFLYVGVFLRSFPWTRAAGGSMVSLFIAFYVIFPALLYPFSVISVTISSSVSSCAALSQPLSLLSFSSYNCVTGAFLLGALTSFVNQISYSVLQVFGVVVAFLISFDLIERLGDILGAPSLQGKKLLSKVI